MRAPDVVLTGRYDQRDARRHHLVPFRVPPGVGQLHLRYAFNDRVDSDPSLTGGNTLDLGLFDERGTAVDSPAFRGWSGSERSVLTIDRAWATPPYVPGPIGPGTWHAILGPYKVAPQGLDWRVEIWLDLGVAPPEPPALPAPAPRPAVPPAAEPGWIRGDLHCHTRYSDGDSWPGDMLRTAAAAGLDFLGVTDHNGVAHHAAYGAGGAPLVLPGVEVTTYRGHWNAWGVTAPPDFLDVGDDAVAAAMTRASADGAVVSVCHPKPLGPAWEYERARGYDAIEAWNGPWRIANDASLAFWDAHLARGERVVAVGGSDTHELRRDADGRAPGTPTTWVRADRSVGAILAAIRRGDVFVSASPAGPQLYVDRERATLRVRAVGAAGTTLRVLAAGRPPAEIAVDGDDVRREVAVGDAPYARAEIARDGEVVALSNARWR